MSHSHGVIHVPTPLLISTTLPLVAIAVASYFMELGLESPILVGTIRAGVQLTILGSILQPIFAYGLQHVWLVLVYLLFMLTVASIEAAARSKYIFPNMTLYVLAVFCFNVGLVGTFTIGFVIRPHPVYDPQYVIPICGMLLANCVNGTSLVLDSILTVFVEEYDEVEMFLSFGATSTEASARVVRESIRVASMPMLNAMVVIGLVSIPGMMTGQILGGSNIMEAARYQMMIVYLCAIVAFGTIFCEVWLARHIAFDKRHMLQRHLFEKRSEQLSFFACLTATGRRFCNLIQSQNYIRVNVSEAFKELNDDSQSEIELAHNDGGDDDRDGENFDNVESNWDSTTNPSSVLELIVVKTKSSKSVTFDTLLEIQNVSRTVTNGGESRTLFENLSLTIQKGDVVVCRGPSGAGKSQLARLIGGIGQGDGHMNLNGQPYLNDTNDWRRQVRYVSQYKVTIPGTPRDFMSCVSKLRSWRNSNNEVLTMKHLLAETSNLVETWGLPVSTLDREWKQLSGGEAQRVYLAIALASRPEVLLMDDSTSAMDLVTKKRVEASMIQATAQFGLAVLFVTHDQEQMKRLSANENGL